ncbi:MAG: acetyl-CoA carboxylase biotin carboxylase subunit [Sphingobacteriales bacterium]|jgi:acetyl-CoA carboxylase biotin carboxylase subunit|nr:acetyl-CoA carboxylase biotin carboxylase subunit [Sphingobacteriales bacterium]MBP9141144.1 acetyl-CoA carboxylase biotin carboxylase subunit [Chitinophagales bacterium]MDA0198317.1 acetyl-CoA carboxylase biotin carboxylase subunit [Bacteroidota bacterium]MBK7527959.1 acetyl-CoA carboxylase biotin carboxylase subunit [Sphingobacteriales bacterium]MBL0246313.1 acetyl-CoA carboxylase biotin carboxylase subunit [Sphingobacteriales bacterium]
MQKVLIANRGEIALRIMRSLKEMNIITVAVFSEADRNAPHVHFADEAYCIGPAPSRESYLRGDVIISTALACQAQGIHPGFGFLSENAAFALAVQQAGLQFIGPSAQAMEAMGNKLAAKAVAQQHNVPMVPGTQTSISDLDEAKQIALKIGFPVLIKAAAGGGGKGMRIINNPNEFEEQTNRAMSEALSAFGDGSVFIEKFVRSPRHIEIQILADSFGNVVHLHERECSIQRRHQKLIEEAPSSILTPEIRAAMGQSAVNLAKAVQYTGAGTVEFLLDDQLNYYFLEMNTRLQVEHPVTEFITGIDIVKEQIRIARGEPLGYQQADIPLIGHAIELRICAEDPENNFLPDIGTLTTYRPPLGPGIRVDDGFEQGMAIPIQYDPMIAKLIVYAPDRKTCIAKMLAAINQYAIEGVKTTLPFGAWVMQDPLFINGQFDTNFIAQYFNPEVLKTPKHPEIAEIAARLGTQLLQKSTSTSTIEQQPTSNLNYVDTPKPKSLGSPLWRINRLR